MWFFSAPKTLRAPSTRSQRGTFRPRFEALEDRCLLSAGALDPTFGSGGLVLGPNVSRDYINAVAVQTDGKIVAGGYVTSTIGTSNGTNFALVRYNPNGSLDTTFGSGGVVQTTTIGAGGSRIDGLTLQSDGKIVAVGFAYASLQPVLDPAFVVARYNTNGSLDTTFGTNHNGIVSTNVLAATRSSLGTDYANAVAIQGDGKIDVAGISWAGSPTTDNTKFTLVRYNANGTLDKTFGPSKNGIVVTPTFGNIADYARALAVQSDGKILLVGNTGANLNLNFPPSGAMAVARYTQTGQLDSSFGNNGIAMGLAPPGSTAAANGVLVQSNGAIVIAGYSYDGTSVNLTLARLGTTGHLDTTFGISGFAFNTYIRYGYAVAQGANGDLLAAGTAGTDAGYSATDDFGVAAFLPNGTPDTTFGTGGTTTADFSGGRDYAYAMAIQGDGKIVVAGPSISSTDAEFALARFLPPNTKIGSFTANPNPVAAGGSVTLTVSGILNSNPSSTISNVVFYLDSLGGTPLAPTFISNSNGTWTYSFDTTGLAAGSHTLYTQAVDSNGVFSDPLAIPLQVL